MSFCVDYHHLYSYVDSVRPSIETVFGTSFSLMANVCGRTLSTLYGPHAQCSYLCYLQFAILSAASDAIVVVGDGLLIHSPLP